METRQKRMRVRVKGRRKLEPSKNASKQEEIKAVQTDGRRKGEIFCHDE